MKNKYRRSENGSDRGTCVDEYEHDCDGCVYCETLDAIDVLGGPLEEFCSDDSDPITQRLAFAATAVLDLLACRIIVDLMDGADEDDQLPRGRRV